MKERDYIADLRKHLDWLGAQNPKRDQLRALEKIETFCHAAVERLRSEKTEAYFNEFLENN